ncbi:MlaE family ABC transporter permease [Spirochaeta cellobiosiphila]|uniref:MlaE family ABC transporter permease n=1 Tax=Spirochaeta cellobiosiphila TaxID=504483 RepID=UPI00042A830F|nr:ABC transporter permease [Spirochaeta cellobiosiphila]
MPNLGIKKITKTIASHFEVLGRFYAYLMQVVRWMFTPPFRIGRIFEELEKIGANSFPVIALSSTAIGMIFALQLNYLLGIFRSEILIGAAVGLTMARELAPFITALMLVARDGSAMAAEIGTMKVTEQLDAMETMTINPIHFLVVPKVYAALIAFPLLTGASNLMGVAGAYLVGVIGLGVDSSGFFDQMYWFLDPTDILSGLIKSVVLGFFISIICTFYGYYTERGAKAVGESTTKAVVTSALMIFFADYIMTDLMLKLLY